VNASVPRSAACLALATGLAGCGLSHGAPAAPAPSAHPSAKRIYALMTHSMHRVHSLTMHMSAVEVIGHHRIRNHVITRIDLPGRTEQIVSFKGQRNTTLNVGRHAYFKLNAAALYAIDHNATAAEEHDNLWFAQPSSAITIAVAKSLQRPTFGACQFTGAPHQLGFVRSASDNGVPTWVISDRGGNQQRTLEISSGEPHLLLRINGTISGLPLISPSTSSSCSGSQGTVLRASAAINNALVRRSGVQVKRVSLSFGGYNAPQGLHAPRHVSKLPTPRVTQH
jgi:hypothetical protein